MLSCLDSGDSKLKSTPNPHLTLMIQRQNRIAKVGDYALKADNRQCSCTSMCFHASVILACRRNVHACLKIEMLFKMGEEGQILGRRTI